MSLFKVKKSSFTVINKEKILIIFCFCFIKIISSSVDNTITTTTTSANKMNSTIGIARNATTNGCVLNGGAFLAASVGAAATAANGSVAAKTLMVNNGIHTQQHKVTANSNVNQLHQTTATITTNTTASNNNNNNTHTVTPSTRNVSKKTDLASKIIQQSHIICFDVDSTVIKEEGIDELAEFCGKGSEVARVTKEAMGGGITFQDALTIRLNIIRPTQKQIADFIKLRPSTLTRNVKRFIDQLKADGKQVYLISGGFDCLIEPVANELGIPLTQLFANKLLFYFNGEYAGFDTKQPTSKSGGKADAISIIKRQNPNALITMIGDGATDLEAVPPANYFIGFGGNIVRGEVQKRAQYYITDFEQLMQPKTINNGNCA